MSKRDEKLQKAFSHHRSGNLSEAAKLYRSILRQNPREPAALQSLGTILSAQGDYGEAAALMARSLTVRPDDVQFIQNYATVLCQLGQFKNASEVSLRGLALDPGNSYLLYVAAAAFLQQDRVHDSLSKYDELLAREPNHVAALTERSSARMALQQYDAALADLERAIAVHPQYADAHLNRGILFGRLKRHDEAVACFEQALRLNPNSANAWLGLGNVFFDQRQDDKALAAYDRALALSPGSAEAHLGRANALFDLKRHGEALSTYDRALSLQPRLSEAWLGRGNVLFDLARNQEALAAYDQALSLKAQSAEAQAGRGNALAQLKQYGQAAEAYGAALSLKPDLVGLRGDRIFLRMQLCDWDDIAAETDQLRQSVRAGEATISPFNFLVTASSAEEQLRCARAWVARRYPAQLPLWRGERYDHARIRVGYVSADFRNHPVALLAAGIFRAHDRARFEAIGFSIAPGDQSEVGARIEKSFDKFVHLAEADVDAIARRIRAEEVNLLIDLNGFTQNARPGIFARRPAPLQVNYLGYPGTMGADYVDYIVADRVLVPPGDEVGYAEKIVRLPHSYLPHDDVSRPISDRAFTRAECGLPGSGLAFCCFNNAYKLDPAAFEVRMRILKAVDGSVLWLSDMQPSAMENLRRRAAAAGIDPDRLVFAARQPLLADHLARHRLADLFLDTLPYNAHTTASDALWAGLPVLTQSGDNFAGRVAASLLSAAGLPDLI